MTIAYKYVSGISGATGGTSSSCGLASSTDGDLLIAWVQVTSGGKTFTVNSGWTIGDQQNDGNSSSAWAWAISDGSVPNPAFSWSGSATWHAQCSSYGGVDQLSPIGTTHKNIGNSATLSVTSITSTGPSSLALCLAFANGSVSITTPSGYSTEYNFSDAFGTDDVFDQALGSSGSTSNAVSISIASAPWSAFIIELLSPTSGGWLGPTYITKSPSGGMYGGGASSSTGYTIPEAAMGDLMVGIVYLDAGGLTFTQSSGWIMGDFLNAGTLSTAWFYKFKNGTNDTFSPTWSSSHVYYSNCIVFRGAQKITPVGAKSKNSGNSVTALGSGITTTKNNSLVVSLMTSADVDQAIPTPASFFNIDNHHWFTQNIGNRWSYERVPTAGATGDISVSITSAHWHAFLFEILTAPPFDPGDGPALLAAM
jgi:hypothetical protein